ncbi:MAG: hypothetical protein EAZ53_11380 [Bacteroidetes bacterium]|nr:MAG: hypothetical protein EAZ53_11380 [Bacteroidota bacterium]
MKVIDIKKPCEVPLSVMQKTEQGFYCQTCAKNVMDYRSFTNDEILERVPKKGCGVFYQFQLDQINSKHKNQNYLRFFRHFGVILAFMISVIETFAQQTKKAKPPTEVVERKNIEIPKDSFGNNIYNFVWKGSIISDTTIKSLGIAKGDPIIGATIIIDGTTQGTTADIDGNFALKYTSNHPQATLKITFSGLKLIEKAYNYNQNIIIETFKMKEEPIILEEVVVIGYGEMRRSNIISGGMTVNRKPDKCEIKPKKSILSRIKNFFKRIF